MDYNLVLPMYVVSLSFAFVAFLLIRLIRDIQRDSKEEREAMRQERSQLYDRIQAPSFDAFKQYEPEVAEEEVEEPTEVPIDEARDELLGEQING